MTSRFVFGLGLLTIITSLTAGYKWATDWEKTQKKQKVIHVEHADADFVRAAVLSNISEMKLAELALAKSSDPALRKIAAIMKSDHKRILQHLREFADRNSITISDNATITEDHLLRLPLDGDEFEKKWCAEMIGKHERNFQTLEIVWERTENDEVRKIVNTALPHLINHLEALIDYQEHYRGRGADALAIAEEN